MDFAKEIQENFTIYRKIGIKIKNFAKLKKDAVELMKTRYYDADSIKINETLPLCEHTQLKIYLSLEYDCRLYFGTSIKHSSPVATDYCVCRFKELFQERYTSDSDDDEFFKPTCVDNIECKVYFEDRHISLNCDDYDDKLYWNLMNKSIDEQQEDIYIVIKFEYTFKSIRYIPKLFKDFLGNNHFNDIKLICSDNNIVQASAVILARFSSVFKAMFESKMIENQTKVVRISDINSRTMKQLIDFIYTAEIKNVNENLNALLYTAEKYDVKDLKCVCINEVKKELECLCNNEDKYLMNEEQQLIRTIYKTLVFADKYNAKLLFFEVVGIFYYYFHDFDQIRAFVVPNKGIMNKIIAFKESLVKKLTFTYVNKDSDDEPPEKRPRT
ncbi:hypothetical protein PVAND_012531 [Polypedilum vanderplanki]|uniref:BTB domain-containing protein n=1 Tax=Polypedilum vanderplanki TaxID=319348 RepID=A0A9J6CNQ4_POLVA|nr:hypothetical protein PVAND_012531 [Polypedilum vanderplanki]